MKDINLITKQKVIETLIASINKQYNVNITQWSRNKCVHKTLTQYQANKCLPPERVQGLVNMSDSIKAYKGF